MKFFYTLAAALLTLSVSAANVPAFKTVNPDQKRSLNVESVSQLEKASESLGSIALQPVKERTLDITATRAAKAPAQKATQTIGNLTVTTDANGIITEVAGVEPKIYERTAGYSVYVSTDGNLSAAPQAGNVTVVEDGDYVFIKDIIYGITSDAWVMGTRMGTREGDIISFEAGQPIYYASNYDTTIGLYWSAETTYTKGENQRPITYLVDGNTLTLQGTGDPLTDFSNWNVIGYYWDDDNSYYGRWEYGTVLNYNEDYVAPTPIILPDGAEVATWYLNGESLSVDGNQVYADPIKNQEVQVAFVGSEVYICNIFPSMADAWVKGDIADGQISFACPQYLGDYYSYNINFFGTDGEDLTDVFAYYDTDTQTITFNSQLLANAATDRIFYLDYLDQIVITAEKPAEPEVVVLPEGVEIEKWYLNGVSVSEDDMIDLKNQDLNVAFDGNDVYISGLCSMLPDAWVKGSIEGSTITFAKDQYFGNFYDYYDFWFQGVLPSGELVDATAIYDADAKTIVFETYIVSNTSKVDLYTLDFFVNVVISAEPAAYEEPILTEAVAQLPYYNSFDTEAEQAEAVTYDANGDSKTFTFYSDADGYAARYLYNDNKDANDYVVFPGLPLEAGVAYTVKVDARCQSSYYPERFEVVCGTVARVTDLTTVVIAPTEVKNTTYGTFANEEFTVDADGVYFFAIHAISDAGDYYMFIDNFSVEVTVEKMYIFWDNSIKAYTNPVVQYSTDEDGAEFSEPIALIKLEDISFADDDDDIFENPTAEIWAAEIPATATFVKFSDNNLEGTHTEAYAAEEEGLYDGNAATGVENVTVSEPAAVEYFNLQGVRVNNPENGIFIRVEGNNITKIVK